MGHLPREESAKNSDAKICCIPKPCGVNLPNVGKRLRVPSLTKTH
jgi:hypothetical protein